MDGWKCRFAPIALESLDWSLLDFVRTPVRDGDLCGILDWKNHESNVRYWKNRGSDVSPPDALTFSFLASEARIAVDREAKRQKVNRPVRDGGWVQPLNGAFETVLERLNGIQVLTRIVYAYLPRYKIGIQKNDDRNQGRYHTQDLLRIQSAFFCQEDMLSLSVVGNGWESSPWLHKWRDQDKRVRYEQDVQSERNLCGILDWKNRESDVPLPDALTFSFLITADCNAKHEVKSTQTWRHEIIGASHRTEITAPLLDSKSKYLPAKEPIELKFRFQPESTVFSKLRIHMDYCGTWPWFGSLANPKTLAYANMHFIDAHLNVQLTPTTILDKTI